MGVHQHRQAAPTSVGVGILSVSTTRTIEDDESGLWIARRAKKEGHEVRFHQVVTDETTAIPELLQVLDLRGATVTVDAMGWQAPRPAARN